MVLSRAKSSRLTSYSVPNSIRRPVFNFCKLSRFSLHRRLKMAEEEPTVQPQAEGGVRLRAIKLTQELRAAC